ncbi:MAG: shikimate dehydrogenase [Bacteroidetes bacterium]|nr:shikimate dehydrogenase [Bacteroidota bacterium]
MKTYGLIGFPLAHSFSEKFFTDFFKTHEIPAVFKNFPLENAAEFPLLIESNPEINGLAVTIPLKKSILPFIEKKSSEVQQSGACNCIKIKDGKTIGYNTDIVGFEQSFMPHILPHDKHVLILGTGGAAAAAAYVCKKNNIDFLYVSRRKKENAITYEEIDENCMKKFSVIINATPIGQFPDVQDFPSIPYHLIHQKHYCFDMIYNPAHTQFLIKSAAHGARIQNGRQMLEIQAKENWKIWSH